MCASWIPPAVLLAACTAPADHVALRDAGLPAPIPAHRFASPSVAESDYMVSPDGQRFLMNTIIEEATSPLTVILNWKAKP